MKINDTNNGQVTRRRKPSSRKAYVSETGSSQSLLEITAAENPTPPGKWRWAIAVIVLVVATCAVYAPCLHYDFVSWDDDLHIYQNELLDKGQDPIRSIAAFWGGPHKGLYIPITYTAWTVLAHCTRLAQPRQIMAAQQMVDLDPYVFHVVNLIVHVLTVLMIFLLIRTLIRNDLAAGAGSLLFSIHPVQVESVVWISELKGLLCGLFAVAALWFYVKYARETSRTRLIGYGAAATVSFALALLSKPEAAGVPVVAFLLGIAAAGKPGIKSVLPAVWLLAVLVIAGVTSGAQPVSTSVVMTPEWTKPLIAADSIAYYLYKFAIPAQLGIDYGQTPLYVVQHAWGWLWWMVPTAIGLVLWNKRRKYPWLGLSFLIFVAMLLPVAGLINFRFQGHSTVADRYLYLAMLGPALGLAWVVSRTRNPLAIAAIGLWLIALGVKSEVQSRTWENNVTLFHQAIRINHDSWAGYNGLGMALLSLGNYSGAVDAYNRSLQIADDPNAENNIANVYRTMQDFPDAEAHYRTAIRMDPNRATTHMNLGILLGMESRHKEAFDEDQTALNLDPSLAGARQDLGYEQQSIQSGGQ